MKNKTLIYALVGVLLVGTATLIFVKSQNPHNKPDPNFDVATITPPGDKLESGNPHEYVFSNLVSMRSSGFEPSTLTVERGTTVIFRNDELIERWPASDDHPTHRKYPEFDPKKEIPSAEIWTFKFDKVGTWGFHDHLVPSHTGIITVIEKQ